MEAKKLPDFCGNIFGFFCSSLGLKWFLRNDRVIVTGAREIREEAEERVDVKKQLFLNSPPSGSARNYKVLQPPVSNMDMVLALFQTQVEKDDSINTTFAEDMRSAAEEHAHSGACSA